MFIGWFGIWEKVEDVGSSEMEWVVGEELGVGRGYVARVAVEVAAGLEVGGRKKEGVEEGGGVYRGKWFRSSSVETDVWENSARTYYMRKYRSG